MTHPGGHSEAGVRAGDHRHHAEQAAEMHGAGAGHDHGGGDGGGRDRHKGHGAHGEVFRRKFWLSLALSVPVVVFSHMFADLLGYSMPDFPGAQWIAPVLGTVIFFYGGMPFLTGAVSELRARQPGMMLLIGMAISVAFIASWITTLELGGFNLDFWWELALLIVIMLLGHWLEMRALGSASGALDALAALLPDTADKITDDAVTEVPISELTTGDLVLVRAGARVPADGTVTDGEAEVDESMITGESKPVTRTIGDTVVAGTVATDSALRVQISAVGEDTALAGIQRMVAEAQASSSRAQALADRAAAFLFYFHRCRHHHVRRLDAAGQPRRGGRAHRHRPGHRLPACPRPGHPAGDRHFHRTCREGRGAGQGPARPRADAHRRGGPVRQDRHPHPGTARRYRRRRGHGNDRGTAPRPRRGRRIRQ